MDPEHDVQVLSDTDMHVYEAVAAQAVEHDRIGLGELVRATGLTEDDVRESLERLTSRGYVVPQGGGYGLGPHTFGVEH